ncbi:neutral ceramidase-like [Epargyreus clarus]|uniref:neutral ceramidase-like n=1 Tax=Epargyreus clarus TaxID=520877 RepID=UPI003C2FD072
MGMTLLGKVVTLVILLGVIGGMTAVIILVVNDASEDKITPTPSPPDATTDETETSTGGRSLPYEVGVGIADMTGPCVEITFMGYAELGQTGRGIHLRQYSRAFIFVKGNTRVVLVSAEVQAVGIAVRREVVKNLQELYGDMYSLRNVIMMGTHTHSAPGGHLVDFLLDISILGFSRETYNAYVAGITRSIVRAHENIVPARLFAGKTRVWNAHMNRSPYSYGYNPAEERDRYGTDTDNELLQLRIEKEDGSLHGVLNWFSVHTTSMNMTNQLISTDNLGYAALRLENTLNPGKQTGKAEIVAAFFPASLGDVSPNIRGARCEFSGDACDNQFLLCAAAERCYSLGPGDDMFESTRIIGTAVFEGALEVLKQPGKELTGKLAVIHQFVDMPEEVVARYDPVARRFNTSDPVNGCVPAMGYSFASGTIDGANVLNITQGTIVGNPLLDSISAVIARPTPEDIACHRPKPILLATGRTNIPFPWHPRVTSISLVWLGGFAVAGIPGEPTTMAGRRVQDVVGSVMKMYGYQPWVAISGLTNEYIHYVSTFEEYQVQRYEAASTIFGPHTLDIFLNKFYEFTKIAIERGDVPPGPEPADHRNRTISLILPVILDNSPIGRRFGDVLEQPPPSVKRGEIVSATFVAANPRNDLRQEGSHAAVERFELGAWSVVATDADWDTVFEWERVSTALGTSRARLAWRVPRAAVRAPHRLAYSGAARTLLGNLIPFRGYTNTFYIDDTV